MTNQNVIAPNLKSQINSVIAVLMSIPNSPVLPGAGVPESMAVLREFLKGTSQKKLMKRTNDGEGKGGAKVTSWIDSMRASSPPRVRPTTVHDCENLDLHHPSALNVFDQIIHKARGKKIITFLDYDGTLSPIVADPEKAYMTEKMRETVKDIARHFPTAIVTGRCIDTVYNFVRLAELYYAGSHGMDIKGPTKTKNSEKGKQAVLFQPASQFLPMINEVNKILVEKTKSFPGAMVENNKFCLSVHYRCVEEKSWGALAEKVRSVLNDYPKLKLTQGRKVLEIRPNIKWDKGKALEFLLRSLGYAKSQDVFPIYIGDDRTDEDAFKVLRNRGQGIGILVSKAPRETDASYTLQDPTEVEQFLRRLVEWKRRRVNPITSVETCRL